MRPSLAYVRRLLRGRRTPLWALSGNKPKGRAFSYVAGRCRSAARSQAPRGEGHAGGQRWLESCRQSIMQQHLPASLCEGCLGRHEVDEGGQLQDGKGGPGSARLPAIGGNKVVPSSLTLMYQPHLRAVEVAFLIPKLLLTLSSSVLLPSFFSIFLCKESPLT